MLSGMKLVFVLTMLVTLGQGTAQPPQSNIPVTSSDPFTREMEDKLGKILEIQNEREMGNGQPSTLDRHEAAMLSEMVKQLQRLTDAVTQATANPNDIAKRKAGYKEMESQSGKLLSGLKYFIPVINDTQSRPEQPTLIPETQLRTTYAGLAPRLADVIHSIKTGVIHLNDARTVVSQLRMFQETGKRAGSAKE